MALHVHQQQRRAAAEAQAQQEARTAPAMSAGLVNAAAQSLPALPGSLPRIANSHIVERRRYDHLHEADDRTSVDAGNGGDETESDGEVEGEEYARKKEVALQQEDSEDEEDVPLPRDLGDERRRSSDSMFHQRWQRRSV